MFVNIPSLGYCGKVPKKKIIPISSVLKLLFKNKVVISSLNYLSLSNISVINISIVYTS